MTTQTLHFTLLTTIGMPVYVETIEHKCRDLLLDSGPFWEIHVKLIPLNTLTKAY